MRTIKSTVVLLTALAVSATAYAQAGGSGNGNGGAGGGNAHAAATAAPTVGGDNTSTPKSSRKAPHLRHKKHSNAMQPDAQ